MAESAPLLSDVDDSAPHVGGDHDKETPASALFKRPIKALTITTLVLSALNIALLIASYNVVRHTPAGYTWWTEQKHLALIPVTVAALVFSIINVLTHQFPILGNIIVDGFLAGFLIAKVVGFIEAFPDMSWCAIRYRYPGHEPIYPDPRCEQFKLVATVLMGVIAGFTIIIAAIHIIQLLLRALALYRVKIWKRPLAWTLPTGEITFQISLRVLRQEPAAQNTTGGQAGGVHGPVYLS